MTHSGEDLNRPEGGAPPGHYPTYGNYPQPNPLSQARMPYPSGPMVVARQTNGLAMASLICACAGVIPFLGIVGVILGVVFGFIAKGQIRRTGGVQEGSGLATAGIVISIVVTAVWIILLAAFGHFSTSTCTNGFCSG